MDKSRPEDKHWKNPTIHNQSSSNSSQGMRAGLGRISEKCDQKKFVLELCKYRKTFCTFVHILNLVLLYQKTL